MPTKEVGEYHLLIEPVVVSRARRTVFFKPKDVVQYEPYTLKLKISNKGSRHFPGGFCRVEIHYSSVGLGAAVEQLPEVAIPGIAVNETETIETRTVSAVAEGVALTYVKVRSADGATVKYYQKEHATHSLSLLDARDSNPLQKKIDADYIMDMYFWWDYFGVTSRYELNQRYTNYLLVFLSGILVALTVITIILLVVS